MADILVRAFPHVTRRAVIPTVVSGLLAGGLLVAGAAPVLATAMHPQDFGIPGVHGISAWGSYERLAHRQVRVTVCVKIVARDVYGGAAAAVAFGSGRAHQAIAAVAIGYGHSTCLAMRTRDTAHLTAEAVSGYPNGKIRDRGPVIQIY